MDGGIADAVQIMSIGLGLLQPAGHDLVDNRQRADGGGFDRRPEQVLLLPFNRRVWFYIGERYFPEWETASLTRRLKLFAHAQLKRAVVSDWHRRPFGKHAAEILWRHPLLPLTPKRPYIDAAWTTAQKQRVIEGHYALLTGPRAVLDFPLDQAVTVLTMDEIFPGLSLTIDKPFWFFNEGEVVFSLFVAGERAYSLAFTLARVDNGIIAYVGALQGGGHGETVVERNRLLTKAAHGMRPRDLLFACFRVLCGQLGVSEIYAPRSSHSVLRSDYFPSKRHTSSLDHDATWTELGGTICSRTNMFTIPAAVSTRRAEDVPAKKRAVYRRRYEMLDALASDMVRSLRQRV